MARLVVASFRRDAARAGADTEVAHLVAELSQSSPEFAAMWRDEDVQTDSNGVKHLRHPQTGHDNPGIFVLCGGRAAGLEFDCLQPRRRNRPAPHRGVYRCGITFCAAGVGAFLIIASPRGTAALWTGFTGGAI